MPSKVSGYRALSLLRIELTETSIFGSIINTGRRFFKTHSHHIQCQEIEVLFSFLFLFSERSNW